MLFLILILILLLFLILILILLLFLILTLILFLTLTQPQPSPRQSYQRFPANSLNHGTPAADVRRMSINPISSAFSSQANEAAKLAAPQPQSQQKSSPLPSDTVSLKSTGNVDQDGDAK